MFFDVFLNLRCFWLGCLGRLSFLCFSFSFLFFFLDLSLFFKQFVFVEVWIFDKSSSFFFPLFFFCCLFFGCYCFFFVLFCSLLFAFLFLFLTAIPPANANKRWLEEKVLEHGLFRRLFQIQKSRFYSLPTPPPPFFFFFSSLSPSPFISFFLKTSILGYRHGGMMMLGKGRGSSPKTRGGVSAPKPITLGSMNPFSFYFY